MTIDKIMAELAKVTIAEFPSPMVACCAVDLLIAWNDSQADKRSARDSAKAS